MSNPGRHSAFHCPVAATRRRGAGRGPGVDVGLRVAHHGLRLALLVTLAPAVVAAQQPIAEARSADPGGTVKISVPSGTVRVTGWDRDSVELGGTIGGGQRLEFGIQGRETRIRIVPVPDAREGGASALRVRVPRGSHVAIRTSSADVNVDDLQGAVDVASVSGSIRVSGNARTIYAESAAGSVDIEAYTKVVRAKSVDGAVTVRRAAGFVEVSTVSGTATVMGRNLWEGQVTTVSGDIRFEGGFDSPGSFRFETHSGAIALVLPSSVRADVDIVAFGGRVESDFGPAGARAFSTGPDGTRLTIKSFKGDIRIRRQR